VWINALRYYADGWTVRPSQELWISDPGQIDDAGERVYRADGQPWGEPTWRLGDWTGSALVGRHLQGAGARRGHRAPAL
jgi:hypothetical protein